jgi:4-carboxymuconolactone decarboxylase
MIVEGYGKVLSRPALDLPRRELCIVAACAASKQDRQLHSHLHGALNVGVEPDVIEATIDAIADLLDETHAHSVRLLWARVKGK